MPGLVVPAGTLTRQDGRPAASSSEGKERGNSPRRSCQISSSPAQAGDPVRRGLSVRSLSSLEYWIVRPSAQLRTRRTMTTEYEAAISRRISPEFCIFVWPSSNRGRREDRVLAAPAVSRAICANKRAHEHTGQRGIPAFPAQWLYGLLRALPGERLFCLRRLRFLSHA